MLTSTEKILQDLIAFPSVSRDSNRQLIGYIEAYLQQFGIDSQLSYNDDQTKANLYAVVGPGGTPGVMLSGHTDVVPVDGQTWSVEPFVLSPRAERLYGRGTTDMKGFIAAVLALLPAACNAKLTRSLHLAFSYDEELGCLGVHRMLAQLQQSIEAARIARPAFCIVGEPTEMQVGIAHKGKLGATCTCYGVEAHSALATQGVNAIYLATDMIAALRQLQREVIQHHPHDSAYAVPYSTLHVGTIEGGTALNIIPKQCQFRFEIRHLPSDDAEALLHRLREHAAALVAEQRAEFPQVGIEIEVFNQYPGLDTAADAAVVKWVQSLLDNPQQTKLAYGTEGGLFQQRLAVPTVVCGPGSMQQGHKADEFIERRELARCDTFLAALLRQISN